MMWHACHMCYILNTSGVYTMVFCFFALTQIIVDIIYVHIKVLSFRLLVTKQVHTAAMNQLHTAAFVSRTFKHTALTLNWKKQNAVNWYSDRLWAGQPRNWGSIPVRDKDFLFYAASRAAQGPCHHPIQWLLRACFPMVTWQRQRLTTHLHLVLRSRMLQLYLHSPCVFMALCLINLAQEKLHLFLLCETATFPILKSLSA